MINNSIQELVDIDIRTRQNLLKLGFLSLGCWGNILDRGLPIEPILKNQGVYTILRNNPRNPVFYKPVEVQRRGNVIKPLSICSLQTRWVTGVPVLYFGAAGLRSNRTLRQRLNDMRRHCLGETTKNGPHRGGEILWQVQGYKKFELMIMRTDEYPLPRAWECALNNRFLVLCGKLPFANCQL
jgi:hypothetical protein